jgi:protein gp37
MPDSNAYQAPLLNPGNGSGARPMDVEWVRDMPAQRQRPGVPTIPFVKQWGGRTPKAGGRDLDGRTWDQVPALAVGPGDDR